MASNSADSVSSGGFSASLFSIVLVAPGSTERGFVSVVHQLESTIERFLAATGAFLCFAVRKFRFRDNLKGVSTRLLYYVRINFAVLESVKAMRANQHPSRHVGSLRLLWFDAGVHNRTAQIR